MSAKGSASLVMEYVNSYGRTVRRPRQRIERIEALYLDRWTQAAIAEELDVDLRTVRRWLKKMGYVQKRGGPPNRFTLAEVLARRVKTGDGCWEWQGAFSRNGYGNLSYGGKWFPAHRAAYLVAVGPIPPGLLVCHKCDNPPCCRPDHLFVGTYGDNNRDAIAKGRR